MVLYQQHPFRVYWIEYEDLSSETGVSRFAVSHSEYIVCL